MGSCSRVPANGLRAEEAALANSTTPKLRSRSMCQPSRLGVKAKISPYNAQP